MERNIRHRIHVVTGCKRVNQPAAQDDFKPAFRDMSTGRVEYARFRNGRLAPVHLIEGLPMDWAVSYAPDGAVTAVKPAIVPGFVRGSRFYTREEAVLAG